jgi:hypothetical protein
MFPADKINHKDVELVLITNDLQSSNLMEITLKSKEEIVTNPHAVILSVRITIE